MGRRMAVALLDDWLRSCCLVAFIGCVGCCNFAAATAADVVQSDDKEARNCATRQADVEGVSDCPEYWNFDDETMLLQTRAGSRRAEGLPLVVFTGTERHDAIEFRWDKNRTRCWKHKVHYRPEMQKSLRCKGSFGVTCEECVDAFNCWQRAVNARAVTLANHTDWDVHVNLIHIASSSRDVRLSLRVPEGQLVNGELEVLWDGERISHASDLTIDRDSPTLPLVHTGGHFPGAIIVAHAKHVTVNHEPHQLAVIFTARAPQAKVRLENFEVSMPTEYVMCEDRLACLKKLGFSIAGMELRNKNRHKAKCLADEKPEIVCSSWRACLKRSGYIDSMRIFMQAALIPSHVVFENFTSLSSQDGRATLGVARSLVGDDNKKLVLPSSERRWLAAGLSAATGARAEALRGAFQRTCINPEVDDVEAWCCDCRRSVTKACEDLRGNPMFSEVACLRALWCASPHVCSFWKAAVCHLEDVAALTTTYQLRPGLLRRGASAASSSGENDTPQATRGLQLRELDTTMGRKAR